jgi:hypothetical protein
LGGRLINELLSLSPSDPDQALKYPTTRWAKSLIQMRAWRDRFLAHMFLFASISLDPPFLYFSLFSHSIFLSFSEWDVIDCGADLLDAALAPDKNLMWLRIRL